MKYSLENDVFPPSFPFLVIFASFCVILRHLTHVARNCFYSKHFYKSYSRNWNTNKCGKGELYDEKYFFSFFPFFFVLFTSLCVIWCMWRANFFLQNPSTNHIQEIEVQTNAAKVTYKLKKTVLPLFFIIFTSFCVICRPWRTNFFL